MKSCSQVYHNSTFDIHGEALEAIEFLRRHFYQSSDVSIENLKFIFAEITERFGGTISCVIISLMSKTGYEIWLVDLDESLDKPAWFQGESYNNFSDAHELAVLKLLNFKIPEIDDSKNSLLKNTDLFRLKKAILYGLDMKRHFVEKQTGDKIQITCTLKSERMAYTGESTTNRIPKKAGASRFYWRKIEIREAREKAQDQAETKFFRDVFGIDGPNEFIVDELGRPVLQD